MARRFRQAKKVSPPRAVPRWRLAPEEQVPEKSLKKSKLKKSKLKKNELKKNRQDAAMEAGQSGHQDRPLRPRGNNAHSSQAGLPADHRWSAVRGRHGVVARGAAGDVAGGAAARSEEHTSELQSRENL